MSQPVVPKIAKLLWYGLSNQFVRNDKNVVSKLSEMLTFNLKRAEKAFGKDHPIYKEYSSIIKDFEKLMDRLKKLSEDVKKHVKFD